jgi:hypothetical protein
MDLNIMRWQVIQHVYNVRYTVVSEDEKTSTWIGDSWLIFFPKQTIVIQPGNQIKMLFEHPMTIRLGFTVVAVNETSALLFGGLTLIGSEQRVLNDLWHFSLKTFTWKEVIYRDTSGLIPS